MSKKQLKLSISTPCSEDWNNMTADKNGRFCASCQKTVIDFSAMTDAQIIHYFTHFKGETCGRLTEKQLNSVISEPLTTKPNNRWAWALSALLLPTVAASQTVKTTEQSEMVTPSVFEAKNAEKGLPIEGKIVELGSDLPLTDATICILINDELVASVRVNKEGLFKVYLPKTYENQSFTLLILNEGMEQQRLIFNNYRDVLNSQLFISMEKIKATNPIKLRGIVVDSRNEPLPFATIIVKNKMMGCQSDFDGNFELKFSSQNVDNQIFEVEVSMLGMKTNVVKINLSEMNKEIKIMLIEDPLIAQSIAVVCYQMMGKVDFRRSSEAENVVKELPLLRKFFKFKELSLNTIRRTQSGFKNLFRKKHRD